MVIIILLILLFLFLNIKNDKNIYKNNAIIKKTYIKKLKIENKLLFYNLTKFEKNLLNKVKNNFVLLKNCDEDLFLEIEKAEINKDYPTIKIDICDCKNYEKLKKYLYAIKKIENMSYNVNVFILFSKLNGLSFREILYLSSKFKFRSVIKIIDEEFMSVKLMSLINILNIDREDDPTFNIIKTGIEVCGKKYFYGFEEYKNFCFSSEISELKFYAKKTRTFDFENKFDCEKFYFENLTNKNLSIKFWYVKNLLNLKKQKYFLTKFNRFKNLVCVNKEKIFLEDNVCFDKKIMTKERLVLFKNIVVKPNQKFEFFVVKSKEKFEDFAFEKVVYNGFSEITNKYLKLPKIKVVTPNNALNKLINFHLPQEIIKNYVYSSNKNKKDFEEFLGDFSKENLETNDSFKNLNFYFLPQKNLGFVYQNLMYNLIGICFLKEGVFVNKFKKNILGDTKIFFNEICLEIKKIDCDNLSYKIGNVEFSNIDTISYDTLFKSKNLVLQL